MAHFARYRQHFASRGNTRYQWGRNGPIVGPSRYHWRKEPFRYDRFAAGCVFV